MLEDVLAYLFYTMRRDLIEPIMLEVRNTTLVFRSKSETYHCATKLLGTTIRVGAFERGGNFSFAIIASEKVSFLILCRDHIPRSYREL